jgi:hypothetical protein
VGGSLRLKARLWFCSSRNDFIGDFSEPDVGVLGKPCKWFESADRVVDTDPSTAVDN